MRDFQALYDHLQVKSLGSADETGNNWRAYDDPYMADAGTQTECQHGYDAHDIRVGHALFNESAVAELEEFFIGTDEELLDGASGSAASHQTMSALSDLETSCVEAGGNKPGKYYVADFSFDAAEEDGDHDVFRIARENRKTSFRTTGEWWAAMQREVAANMHWEEEHASSPSLPSSSSTCRDPETSCSDLPESGGVFCLLYASF